MNSVEMVYAFDIIKTAMVNDVRELTDSTDLSMTRITESFANIFKKQDADERRELASIDGTEEFVTESIGDAIAGTVDSVLHQDRH